MIATVLAYQGFYQPQDAESVPPIGINLIVVLPVLLVSLATSTSLRRLLTRQANLIRLHLWRLVGIVFLALMVRGQVPAVGLGIMTSPGPTQVFEIAPTSELMTHFPMALVPTFLVPLAFTLHVISLWQLLGNPWVTRPAAAPAASR